MEDAIYVSYSVPKMTIYVIGTMVIYLICAGIDYVREDYIQMIEG